MQPYARTYRSREIAQKMGLRNVPVIREGRLIPCMMIGARWIYDADYVDILMEKLHQMYGNDEPVYDGYFLQLFQLGQTYEEYFAHRKKNDKVPRDITNLLQQLASRGGIYPLVYFAEKLPIYTEQAFRHWARRGKLVTVNVGKKLYVSGKYARHVVWTMNHCETVDEACERLGASRRGLYGAIEEGRVPAFKDVNGRWRIDPEKVTTLPWTRPAADVSPAELMRRTGVCKTTLVNAIARGAVQTNAKEKGIRVRSIPREEAERWVRQFTTLQPGFEWLQEQIESKQQPAQTLSPKQVARELGVQRKAILYWCNADLLPYFVRSFVEKGKMERRFILRLYVFGLKRFAKCMPVRYEQLQKYAALCAAAKVIV